MPITHTMSTFPRTTLRRSVAAGLVALVATLALLAAAPGQAAAKPTIGFGDQHASMFFDTRMTDFLKVKQARLVVAWDYDRRKQERAGVGDWIARAQSYGIEPFIQFGRSWERRYRYDTPSVAKYRKVFRAFRKRYPGVKVFNPWNEVNHCSQPTCKSPKLAARYYNAMRAECKGKCTIVAADVIDQKNFVGWLKTFKKHAKGKPRLWGVHNYLDVNYGRTSGTKAILRTLPGEIWFTETGGIVRRTLDKKEPFNEGIPHQTKATKQVFRLARLSPRIKRIYFYHFNVTNPKAYWDSAFIDRKSRSRPAFDVLARYLGLDPRKAPGKRLKK